jgi:nucleoid-associated protein YgaU
MTRDVKIGLLLGLAFIFMIAFVINGLPSFRGDGNELTKTMVDFPNGRPGIGANEREVIDWTKSIEKQSFIVQNPPAGDPNIRFTKTLSDVPSSLQETKIVKPVAPRPVDDKTTEVKRIETVKPALPKVYIVADNDNLALIAKKFYGDEEGNKRANIVRIFEANRNLLKTPDDIYVGQKLIIPPLSSPAADESKGILSSSVFEKVKSIGREHLSLKKPEQAKQGKSYTVRDGDSLWKIAADQLGDGSRYQEIAKLNADVLSDEDRLTIGMTLKLPPK